MNTITGLPTPILHWEGNVLKITNLTLYATLHVDYAVSSDTTLQSTIVTHGTSASIDFTNRNMTPTGFVNVYQTYTVSVKSDPIVKDITEYEKFASFRPLSEVNKNVSTAVYLKAFIDLKISDNNQYVCRWDKTYNGVDWNDVDTFLNAEDDLPVLLIPTLKTTSDETLTNSNKYELKQFKVFNPSSNTDNLNTRPDFLKVCTDDNATYRFSIYSVACEDIQAAYQNVTLTFEDNVAVESNTSEYYTTEGSVTNIKTDYSRNFKASFELLNGFTPNLTDFYVQFTFSDGTTITRYNIASIVSGSLKIDVPDFQKVQLTDTFVKYFPTLIKIFYKNKVYYTAKEVFILVYDITSTLAVTPRVAVETAYTPSEEFVLNGIMHKITIDTAIDKLTELDTSEHVICTNTPFKINYNAYAFETDTLGHNFNTECTNFESLSTGYQYYVQYISYNFGNFESKNTYNYLSDNLVSPLNAAYLDASKFATCTASTWYEYANNVAYYAAHNPNLGNAGADYYAANVGYFIKMNNYYCILNKTVGTTKVAQVINLGTTIPTEAWTFDDYRINATNANICVNITIPEITFDIKDTDEESAKAYLKLDTNIATKTFSFTYTDKLQALYNDFGSAILGNKLYYKKTIYSFAEPKFKNNILVSEVDSTKTPLLNTIDLSSEADTVVTTVIPWRDYLIAATDQNIYLITKQSEGFTSKVINTFIGIPNSDRRTCKAILNGIIFKSHQKIYVLQPSMYSSDETILNLNEISTPINDFLISTDGADCFAFTTEQAYYIFIRQNSTTTCFKYEYVRRIWSKYTYPVELVDYDILSLNDIRLFDVNGNEYHFEKELKEVYCDSNFTDIVENIRYGDYIKKLNTELPLETLNLSDTTVPIAFSLDTGQKPDNIGVTKQFKETKIILATLSRKDIFPFDLNIDIDGMEHPLKKIQADSPLWKNILSDINTLNTDISTNNADTYNVLKRLFLRHSGRGKSIRYIISGSSYSNFKLYMIYCRYRPINTKQ